MNTLKKIVTSLIITIAMFTFPAQSAFAAGTETWYRNHDGHYTGDFIFEDTNLTPVKTMGDSGTLVFFGDFNKADSGESAVRLTVEIREAYTGRVLTSTTAINSDIQNPTFYTLILNVTAGQKIQIFFDASSVDNPPGFYRWAAVSYNAYIA